MKRQDAVPRVWLGCSYGLARSIDSSSSVSSESFILHLTVAYFTISVCISYVFNWCQLIFHYCEWSFGLLEQFSDHFWLFFCLSVCFIWFQRGKGERDL